MTKTSMQERVVLLMNLVPFLLEHGEISVAALATRFQVSETMIRSLVNFLGTAGIPGETLTYQHEDLYDIDWDLFLDSDIVMLRHVVGIDNTPRFTGAETAAVLAGLQSITPYLSPDLAASAASISQKMSVAVLGNANTHVVSVSALPKNEKIQQVLVAIENKKVLNFLYQDRNGLLSSREAEPVSVTQTAGNWYLRAYCHTRSDFRTFALDRMNTISVSSEKFIRRTGDTAGSDFLATFTSGSNLRVALRATKLGQQLIAEFRPTLIHEDISGHVTLEVELAHPSVVTRLIGSAPSEIEILAPEVARGIVTEWSAQAITRLEE